MRRLAWGAVLGFALAGLGLGVVELSVDQDGDALAAPPAEGWPPDPPAIASKNQWVFDIRVSSGKPSIEAVRSVTVEKPQGTPRMMGRYALELYVGKELLDRVRFNVPLGGDGPRNEDKRPGRERPSFDRVNTKMKVRMADNPRATILRLVDRATGEVKVLPWPWVPPDAGPPPAKDASPKDASTGDASSDASSPPAPKDAGSKDGAR